ncbi:MAG: transporter substrate-binding domain-containing protein [Betaproteobacteria bacterium]|nr:transporter substrate-binding domain-containing protein [Betaproteobacteria bacterium]
MLLEPVLEPYGRIGRHLRNSSCDLTYLIRSPDWDDYVEYVGHLFTFQSIVLSCPSLPLRRYEDLAGLRIELIKDVHLNPRFDEDSQLQKVEVKDYETLVDMLLNGHLDAIASNSVSLSYLLQKRGHASLAPTGAAADQSLGAVQQAPRRAATPRLRAAIDNLKSRGYFDDLMTRYGALPGSRTAVNPRM